MEFGEKARVWLRAHPLSKAEKSFAAKLAPKWQGPYRVVQRKGPVNYEVVLEDTGEDLKTVHISRLKPCYPTTEEVEQQQRQRLLDLFTEESDDEEFKGFPSSASTQDIPSTDVTQNQQDDDQGQRNRVLAIFQEESDEEDFLGFTDM